VLNGAANKDDEGIGITIDGAGNAVIVGYETLADDTTNLLIAKLNGSTGAQIWSFSYDGGANGVDVGSGVIANTAGDLYVTGYVENVAGQGFNILVAKLAGINGTTVWTDFVNGTNNTDDIGNGITMDSTGAIIATGVIRNTNPTVTDDIWTRKYADLGVSSSVTWTRTFNGAANGNDAGFGVGTDSANAVIVSGYETVTGQGANVFVRKYDAAGGTAWTQNFSGGTTFNDIGYGLDVDAQNNVVVGGFQAIANGTADVWVRKFGGATGATLWTQTYNGTNDSDDIVYGVSIDPSGNPVVGGRDVVSGGNVRGWVRKYAP